MESLAITAAIAAAILLLLSCAAPARAAALPRHRLPKPVIPERALAKLYWRSWELGWERFRSTQLGFDFTTAGVEAGGAVNPLAYHPCFTAQYAKYAPRILHIGEILDTLYARQRADGWIPAPPTHRARSHAVSVHLPLYSWAEWDLYLVTGDHARLARVSPLLQRFHRWLQSHHRGPQGLCELRDAAAVAVACQMALDAHCLSLMAEELGDSDAAAVFAAQHTALAQAINQKLWNAQRRWYEDGSNTDAKPVTGLWALLAGVAAPERADAVIAHLTDPRQFWRPTPLPAVPADSEFYHTLDRDLERGAVWPGANYVAVRALLRTGHTGLAKTIALEYLRSLAAQLEQQGALFQCCSPEQDRGAGQPTTTDVVCVGPIAMLIEAVLGLRLDAREGALRWAPRLSDRHGIENLPLGDRTIAVICGARTPGRDYVIHTQNDKPFLLRVTTDFARGTAWRGKKSLGSLDNGEALIGVRAGTADYRISGEPPPDGIPPAQPQHLVARRTDAGVLLRWQACCEEDLVGYHVYRHEDHDWRKVNSSLCMWSSYVDDEPPAGDCRYAVAAVDTAGNVSPMSAPAELAPPAHT